MICIGGSNAPGDCLKLMICIGGSNAPGDCLKLMICIGGSNAPGDCLKLMICIGGSNAPGDCLKLMICKGGSNALGNCLKLMSCIVGSNAPGDCLKLMIFIGGSNAPGDCLKLMGLTHSFLCSYGISLSLTSCTLECMLWTTWPWTRRYCYPLTSSTINGERKPRREKRKEGGGRGKGWVGRGAFECLTTNVMCSAVYFLYNFFVQE